MSQDQDLQARVAAAFLASSREMLELLLDGQTREVLEHVRDVGVAGGSMVLEVTYRSGAPDVRLLLVDQAGRRVPVTKIEFVANESTPSRALLAAPRTCAH